MFCQKCGKQLEEGTKFCPYCGNSTQPTVSETIAEPMPEGEAYQPEVVNPLPGNTPAVKAKKKGGKGKAIIIALVVLLLAAAGAVAAIFLLGDKGEVPAEQQKVINRDYMLYAKNGSLYLTYAENNETIKLSDNFDYYNVSRYVKESYIPSATYYNEATGYLYFPDEIREREYDVDYRLSRIKLDPENTKKYEVETVVDEWINSRKNYRVSSDDSLIIYQNSDGDLYYKNLAKDETAQRLEKDVENVIVDFEKNHCYYNDETEVTYVDLKTMEKKIIFSGASDSYIYIQYAGDGVMLSAYEELYLLDKNGDKTYLSKNGYMSNVEGRYYFIDSTGMYENERIPASDFVTDDCYDSDRDIAYGDEGYDEKVIRDIIRNIISYESIYNYSTDDIYLIEGNDVKKVVSKVSSYSQAGTLPTSCYSFNEPSKIITVSEICDYIIKHYPNVLYGYTVEDYYVTSAIQETYEKYKTHYIIVGDTASVIEAEELNYIGDTLWYSDAYVYFEMSTGSYVGENGYDIYNTSKIYRAPINDDNTLGQYELISGIEGSVTYIGGDNVFHSGELEENESENYDEWYWYTYSGDLYKNGELIDSDVAIVYADSWSGDDFNKYSENKVLYVKNVKNSESGLTADLYFYNGTEAFKLGKQVSDYELSDGEDAYYIDEGDFIRYGAEENTTVDSDVDFIFKAERTAEAEMGW